MAEAVFDQVNIVARDVEASMAFYRRLGMEFPETAIWRSGPHHHAHHVTAQAGDEAGLDIDSVPLARAYNAGFAAERARTVIGFRLPSRAAVDATFEDLLANGHQGLQAPFDAFWGSRYAIVEDPDGNPVGLMSPVDPDRRSPPPAL